MCYTRLVENPGAKITQNNRHLRTIAQLCRVVGLYLRHVWTIGKKLVKQQ